MGGFTSYSIFYLALPFFQGYGGYVKKEGKIALLWLPLYKLKQELEKKMRFCSELAQKEPEEPLLDYLKQALQGKEAQPCFAYTYEHVSPFYQCIYKLCQAIPRGSVLTYGELAEKAGRKNAARAIGQAMAANPLPLIVPCHRVVAKSHLGGYSYGLEVKRKLLELERA